MLINHLRNERNASTLALWGFSMGAVTALLHADRDPRVGALILDSPFSSLTKLVKELFAEHSHIP